MALTVTPNPVNPVDVWGITEVRRIIGQPAAADYAAGGYPLVPGTGISLRAIYDVLFTGGFGGYQPSWNPVTQKVQIFQQSAATGPDTEVPPATDLSAYTFTMILLGN